MFPRPNIDQINILLMLLSLGVAYMIPFGLILLSYAFLGQAHYLTEISWLHDRSYFTNRKRIWIPLTVLSVFIMAIGWFISDQAVPVVVATMMAFALAVGLVVAQTKRGQLYAVAGIAAFLLFWGLLFPNLGIAFAILIPTVIHIYVFTGLFILAGALKSQSKWGYASFAVFLFCGAFFFFVTPNAVMVGTDFVGYNLGNFDYLIDYIVRLVSLEGRVNSHIVVAFLSFAYTYHYLNWFSKTEIIKWHLIPRKRLYVIIAVYLAAVSIYLIDFNVGFLVLSFLSLTHVVLEFPLNAVSVRMIGQSLFGTRKAA